MSKAVEVISAEESREHRIKELDEVVVGHQVVFLYPSHLDKSTPRATTVVRAPYQDPDKTGQEDVWWTDVRYSASGHFPDGVVTRSCGDAGIGPSKYPPTGNFAVDLTLLRERGVVIDGLAFFDKENDGG